MTAGRTLSCEEVRDLAPLFVAGALGAAEMDAVRAHLAACDAAHAEMLELGEAVTMLLETVEPAEPPAALKGRLMAAAARDLADPRLTAPTLAVPRSLPDDLQPPASLARARERRRPAFGWLVAAAAVIAVIALGGWNLSLQRDLASAVAYRDGVNRVLSLAAQPGSLNALLMADDGSASGLGVVGADGTVRLAVRGLAGTAGSQVYTAWTIAGTGAPVPIGEFKVGADGVAVVTARAPAVAPGAILALTLEPRPGATAPTLPIIAKGVALAPAG